MYKRHFQLNEIMWQLPRFASGQSVQSAIGTWRNLATDRARAAARMGRVHSLLALVLMHTILRTTFGSLVIYYGSSAFNPPFVETSLRLAYALSVEAVKLLGLVKEDFHHHHIALYRAVPGRKTIPLVVTGQRGAWTRGYPVSFLPRALGNMLMLSAVLKHTFPWRAGYPPKLRYPFEPAPT